MGRRTGGVGGHKEEKKRGDQKVDIKETIALAGGNRTDNKKKEGGMTNAQDHK